MRIDERCASTGWESVFLRGVEGGVVWVWWHPPQAPLTASVLIPATTFQRVAGTVSLHQVLDALELPAVAVDRWVLPVGEFSTQGGINPLIHCPLPVTTPPTDLTLSLIAAAPALWPVAAVFATPQPEQPGVWQEPLRVDPLGAGGMPAPGGGPVSTGMSSDQEVLMQSIHNDWHAILGLEVQLDAASKQLAGLQTRLQGLNRDLSADENARADSSDKRDWQDARRWLRDCASQLSRLIRDYTIGMVSAAGNRNRFEQYYQTVIVPRQQDGNLREMTREFEHHRRTVQHLLQQMLAAQNSASRDGEQRAKQVLTRIATKGQAKEQRPPKKRT